MHLIGINGFKTSGKDTTYKIVRAIYNDGEAAVLRVAFADKLKIMAARALGFDDSNDNLIALMDEFKEHGLIDFAGAEPGAGTRSISGRQYLQNFGGEARRVFGDTFWIDQVLPEPSRHPANAREDNMRRLDEMYWQQHADLVCVTDVRYPNEAERIKRLGGVVWEVVRPGLVSDGHGSETPLPRDLVDFTVHNEGSLADLEAAVEIALDTLDAPR